MIYRIDYELVIVIEHYRFVLNVIDARSLLFINLFSFSIVL